MNRTGKRLFGIFMSLVMTLTLIPVTALAYEGGQTVQYDDYIPVSEFGGAVTIAEESASVLEEKTVDGVEYIHAKGVGEAAITVDGVNQIVTVEPAQINIVLVMGQSNAAGETANGASTPEKTASPTACEPGTAYLWGKDATEPRVLNDSYAGFRNGLAAEWYAQSKAAGSPEKTVVVFDRTYTARPGAPVSEWQEETGGKASLKTTAEMLNACYDYYDAGAGSENYEITQCGMYWLQGESNAGMSAAEYYRVFMSLWEDLKSETENKLEYCAFLRVRRGTAYNNIQLFGPAVAQYQMTNDHADMYMASTLTESWTGDSYDAEIHVDGSNYCTVDTMNQPLKNLYGGLHYTQMGYNVIGADAAYNMYRALNSGDKKVVAVRASGETVALAAVGARMDSDIRLDEDAEDLMFYLAPGSAEATLELSITSGDSDITSTVVRRADAGNKYAYMVDSAKLAEYVNPDITASLNDETATFHVTTSAAQNPVTPGPSPEGALYYHWNFKDSSTYARGLEDGEVKTDEALVIKTAADSEASGVLTYTDTANTDVSFDAETGLTRSTKANAYFSITNKDSETGIETGKTNGFVIEYTAALANLSGANNSIILSTNPNNTHPNIFNQGDTFKVGGNGLTLSADMKQVDRTQPATYRFSCDGTDYYLTITQNGVKVVDNVKMDNNVGNTWHGTEESGWFVWNSLLSTFSPNNYQFAGTISDLKIWTSYYFNVSVAAAEGTEVNSFLVNGLPKVLGVEDTYTFTVKTADGVDVASVTVSSGKLTENEDGSYTLSGVTADTVVTVALTDDNHHWDGGTVDPAPDCEQEGTRTYHCTDEGCNETRTVTLPAWGHIWNEGTITTAPTHSTAGVRTYTCIRCNKTCTAPVSPLDSVYYHWDFTDADTYEAGLDDAGVSADKAMVIKTAEDSQAVGELTYSNNENSQLSYSAETGLNRSGKTHDYFTITNRDGGTGIHLTLDNGFAMEYTAAFGGASNNNILLGKNNGGSGHPFLFKSGKNQLTIGGIDPKTSVTIPDADMTQPATYRFSYDGTTYHMIVTQAGKTVFDDDLTMTDGDCTDWFVWQYLFPNFSLEDYLFQGSISDLKLWTSYYFKATVDNQAEAVIDGLEGGVLTAEENVFTVTPPDENGVAVTVSNGTLKKVGNTYTLTGVTEDTTITVSADTHTWQEEVTKEATCTEKGEKTFTCADVDCSASRTEEIPALGHDWGEGVVTKEPTHSEKGERRYTCSRCGEQKIEEIASLAVVYYHWDFTSEDVYATTDEGNMVIRTADDSQATGELTYSTSGAGTLTRDASAGLVRENPTAEYFTITNHDGGQGIELSLANGFAMEFVATFNGGTDILLGKGNNTQGHPFLFKNNNAITIYRGDAHTTSNKVFETINPKESATYRLTYDGSDYVLTIIQGETEITETLKFRGGTPETETQPPEGYFNWNYMFPNFNDDGWNFSGSISDLKFWTSYYFTSDITGSSNNTYTLDGLAADGTVTAEENEFTVEAADGYHVVSVTASNGTITKNADGSYTLSDVTADTTIDIQTAAHAFGETWSKDGTHHWHVCTDCGAVADKAEHTWDAGKVTTEASVGIAGEKTYTCTACGATKTEEIPALLPSSGGSGGGFTSTTYPVTVDSGRHGDVTTSTKNAKQGATVTITVKPDDGYELDDLTVTDKNGKTIKVTEGKNGKYTFTMPASKVTVEATFAQIEKAPEHSFTDVPGGHWAESEITWAYESGYMNGNTATTFNPNGTVTRQQLWMILARLSGQRPANFEEAKAWAVDNGVSDGTNPGSAVSRQQLVTILYRYSAMMGYKTGGTADLTVFPDHASVAAYATDAMRWSVANSIVGGTAQGTLNPTGTATRAQFAVILFRFCGNIAK